MNQPLFSNKTAMEPISKGVKTDRQKAAHDLPQDDVLSDDDEPTADGSRVYAKEFDE